MKNIMHRSRYIHNADPQKRCYNGCLWSYEIRWTEWEVLETWDAEICERRIKFWKELNDYAVSERGEGAKREFKIVEITEEGR
jgi:hypothetical protein